LINIAIFGGKGGGTLAAQTVLSLSRARGSCRLTGYLNDRLDIGAPLHGGAVIGRFEDLARLGDDVSFVAPLHKAGFMQANARRIASLGVPAERWAALVDPLANVADGVPIGGGSVLAGGAQAGPDAAIGAHCFLRAGAIVSHDVTIGDYVYLGQTSVVGGYSRVGAGAHIAPGAIIRDGISVGEFALVGMGAVVTKDVPPFAIVQGVPARVTGVVTPAG
jgi:UDP-3-O-[3-hydroxymyristoyl] glucosamine N-acyltransferase